MPPIDETSPASTAERAPGSPVAAASRVALVERQGAMAELHEVDEESLAALLHATRRRQKILGIGFAVPFLLAAFTGPLLAQHGFPSAWLAIAANLGVAAAFGAVQWRAMAAEARELGIAPRAVRELRRRAARVRLGQEAKGQDRYLLLAREVLAHPDLNTARGEPPEG